MPPPRDDYDSRATRRSALHTEGVKGIMLLNGGGILALLTFVTKLMEVPPANGPLIRGTVWAIAAMSLGLIVAAPINHLRYETSRLFDREETKPRGRRLGTAHRALFYGSLACFFLGLAIALTGMLRFAA